MLYLFDDYAFDTDRRELSREARRVPVEPQVFDLLEYLIRHRERVVGNDDLRATVWNGRTVSASALTTRINAARKAIGDSGEAQRLIRTSPRKGIRFVGDVREQPSSAVTPPGSDAGRRGIAPADTAAAPPAASDSPSIAVLPFANLSGDPEQEYFADGITEDISTALARFRSFMVISRNSSFLYKGRAVDVKQVARELGVRYVLEGSIQKAASKIRISGQLIDVESDAYLWADRFDGDLGDVFALQDKVTGSVAAAIEPRVLAAEIARATRKSTSKLAAYDYCLRARPHVLQPTRQGIGEALALLRAATDIDPSYAQAWALMALCVGHSYVRGLDDNPAATTREAVRVAREAVVHDRDDAEVLALAAYMLAGLGAEHDEAAALLDRAIALNPYSNSVCAFGGWARVMCGDLDAAVALFRTGLVLDPFSPHDVSAFLGIAAGHFFLKQHDEAAAWARRALARNPELTSAYRYLAASLAFEGHLAEAHGVIETLLARQPNSSLARSRSNTFRHRWMLDHYLDGLRLAGLQE